MIWSNQRLGASPDHALMAERSRTLWGSSILLTGFGPVGQALGVRLGALGAQVTAAALAQQWIRSL